MYGRGCCVDFFLYEIYYLQMQLFLLLRFCLPFTVVTYVQSFLPWAIRTQLFVSARFSYFFGSLVVYLVSSNRINIQTNLLLFFFLSHIQWSAVRKLYQTAIGTFKCVNMIRLSYGCTYCMYDTNGNLFSILSDLSNR